LILNWPARPLGAIVLVDPNSYGLVMDHPLRRPHRVPTCLTGACLIVLSIAASVCAQTFQEAACYVFEGNENCQTVTIVDQDNCTIKVRPRPLANLDPSIAGCLLDDIQTKKFFPRNARLDLLASSSVRADGQTVLKSTVRISGREVVHVLTEYDQNGAPVWEPQNTYAFELNGDPVRTSRALEHLSICSQQTTTTEATPPSGHPTAGGNTSPRVIGVNEAFRLAAAGNIVLIDIRHESEWRQTGVGENAIPITVHQSMKNFMQQLSEVTGTDKQRPIALICAEGVRSAHLQRELTRWLPQVIDVHEGMLGGPQGPGWINSGLPVKPHNP
jgi:rhodanese-related sulfurtransferase